MVQQKKEKKEEKKEIQIELTREMLLEQRDTLKIEQVQLSRGAVYVREMTGTEKDIWERSMMKRIANPDPNANVEYETTLEDYKGKLAVVTLCDRHGNLLFTMRDVKKLSSMMSASNLEKVIEVAQEINGISQKDKKEILGNLEAGQQEDSSSGSASS
jgi:nitrate reductase NapAB chaperone NapD